MSNPEESSYYGVRDEFAGCLDRLGLDHVDVRAHRLTRRIRHLRRHRVRALLSLRSRSATPPFLPWRFPIPRYASLKAPLGC